MDNAKVPVILVVLGVLLILFIYHNNTLPLSNSSITTSNSTDLSLCDKTLWQHVYHPERLKVIDSCRTVTGIIDNIRVEADGDYHIRLHLDPEFVYMINDANIIQQYGDLVIEPICLNKVTQVDAIQSCSNVSHHITIPPIGTHVRVIGSYVLDIPHGGWAEIHPATSIDEIK